MRPAAQPTPAICKCLALRQVARHVTRFHDRHLASARLRTIRFSRKLWRDAQTPFDATLGIERAAKLRGELHALVCSELR